MCKYSSHALHTITQKCLDPCCNYRSAYYSKQICCGVDFTDDLLNLFFTFVDSQAPLKQTFTTSTQLVTFKIGPNIDSVKVDWEAMTFDSPMTIISGTAVVDVIDDLFSFSIPDSTTDLRVHVTVDNKIVYTSVIPETSPMIKFSSSDLNLFMMFKYANRIAVDTSGIDHAEAKQQLGPHRSSRAMAIVHIAIMNALIAIYGRYNSYQSDQIYTPTASGEAAIAQALHDTLINLFSAQTTRLDEILTNMLAIIPDSLSKTQGITIGSGAAAKIIADRSSDIIEPEKIVGTDYILSGAFGDWADSTGKPALGWKWPNNIALFILSSKDQFPCPFPAITGNPAPTRENYLASREYAMAFNQVKSIGGDGSTTPTARSVLETQIGLYWAYDGTPTLCAPPRLYNQVMMKILTENMNDCLEIIRTMCLGNVAMADTAISCWHYKYLYKLWRPVTAIRDIRTTMVNSQTIPDIFWTPHGAPNSNTSDAPFTPPFPAFPSGHATFGGTIFEILRKALNTDDISFTFTSDELNGITTDLNGVRALVPRSFTSLSQAEDENGYSRMPLGIHFICDKTQGIILGNAIGDYIFDHCFTSLET